MKRFAVLLMAAGLALWTGCPPDAKPPGNNVTSSTGSVPELVEVKPGTKVDLLTHMLAVRVKVVLIELPAGTVSASEEIWSYLDEEPVGADRGAALGRNGLRVGMGRQGNWPDLAKVLKQMTGRSFRQGVKLTAPGVSTAFKLNERDHSSTIFTSHADRSLSGADYPPGRDMLSILCTIDEDEPSTILVTALPQIESARRKPSVSAANGNVAIEVKPTFYNFPELMFQLSVPAGSFLLIGPGAQARRPTSIGHHFLVRKRDRAEFETVVVLTPEVLAVPRPKKKPGPGPAVPAARPPGPRPQPASY